MKQVLPVTGLHPFPIPINHHNLVSSIHSTYKELLKISSMGTELFLTNLASRSMLTAIKQTQMYWDPELAQIAQRHADQCKVRAVHLLGHSLSKSPNTIIDIFQFSHDCSDCRRVSRFGVGQNLYILKQVGNTMHQIGYLQIALPCS